MANKTFREHSKTQFTTDSATVEVITAGSLQRIADAVEVMAKDRVQLERDLQWYKDQYARRGIEIMNLESQIKGLKIARSRFKNQLDKQKENNNNG